MAVKYIPASQEFVDQFVPRKLRDNEFGVNILLRVMSGPAPKLQNFLAGLTQGDIFQGYYLQTWTCDEGAIFPRVTLNYKGLLKGIPEPLISDGTSQQTTSIVAIVPDPVSGSPTLGEDVTYTREIEYYANSFSYNTTSVSGAPRIILSKITGSNGQVFIGSTAPASIVTATTPAEINLITGSSVDPIYGTPYFECSETSSHVFKGA